MNFATIKPLDIANGIGIRVSLFVSGCTHHCKGCFNEEAWDFDYGQPYTEQTEKQIIDALKLDYVTGFSLLGGEPFEPQNQPELAKLLIKIKSVYPEKTVWCYTGYDFEKDLLTGKIGKWDTVKTMLDNIDILVDGEYVDAMKNPDLKFRGSSNQRIIDVKKSLETDDIIFWDEQ